jgi:hypothetical protein
VKHGGLLTPESSKKDFKAFSKVCHAQEVQLIYSSSSRIQLFKISHMSATVSDDNKIELLKYDAGCWLVQIPRTTKFKSILFLLSDACQKGRFHFPLSVPALAKSTEKPLCL